MVSKCHCSLCRLRLGRCRLVAQGGLRCRGQVALPLAGDEVESGWVITWSRLWERLLCAVLLPFPTGTILLPWERVVTKILIVGGRAVSIPPDSIL